jgi:hypothetical protein
MAWVYLTLMILILVLSIYETHIFIADYMENRTRKELLRCVLKFVGLAALLVILIKSIDMIFGLMLLP